MYLLIDGNNLVYRIIHASRGGSDSKVVLGAIRSVSKIVSQFSPRSVLIAWDGSKSARRRAIYPGYKIKKDPRDLDNIDLRVQAGRVINTLNQMFRYLSIRTILVDDMEGDDVIARAAVYVSEEIDRVTIISNDRDFIQLVTDKVTLWRPTKEERITPAVLEYPNRVQFLVAKAIEGDPSDRIEGVPGVGPKTAKIAVSEGLAPNAKMDDETIRAFRAFCADHENKRVRRIDLGFKAVIRNLALIDLSREPVTPEQEAQIKESVFCYVKSDLTSASISLREAGMPSIVTEAAQVSGRFGCLL